MLKDIDMHINRHWVDLEPGWLKDRWKDDYIEKKTPIKIQTLHTKKQWRLVIHALSINRKLGNRWYGLIYPKNHIQSQFWHQYI